MSNKLELKCRWENQKNVRLSASLIAGLDDDEATPQFTKKYVCEMVNSVTPTTSSIIIEYISANKILITCITVVLTLIIGIITFILYKRMINKSTDDNNNQLLDESTSQSMPSLSQASSTNNYTSGNKSPQTPLPPKYRINSYTEDIDYTDTYTDTSPDNSNTRDIPIYSPRPTNKHPPASFPNITTTKHDISGKDGSKCCCGCQTPEVTLHHGVVSIPSDRTHTLPSRVYNNPLSASRINEIVTQYVSFTAPLPDPTPTPIPVITVSRQPFQRRLSFQGTITDPIISPPSLTSQSHKPSTATTNSTSAVTGVKVSPVPSSVAHKDQGEGFFNTSIMSDIVQLNKRSLSFNGLKSNSDSLFTTSSPSSDAVLRASPIRKQRPQPASATTTPSSSSSLGTILKKIRLPGRQAHSTSTSTTSGATTNTTSSPTVEKKVVAPPSTSDQDTCSEDSALVSNANSTSNSMKSPRGVSETSPINRVNNKIPKLTSITRTHTGV